MTTTQTFLGYFSELPDPRQSTKILYPLDEMLLLCLCGVIAGAESFSGIVDYGEEKLGFLRTLKPFEHGIPAHDTMNDLFRALDPQAFEACFTAWVRDLSGNVPGIVAIDGKTLRGSRDGPERALHMVSAWACEQKLIMGQVRTAKKSNEITAIPELLEMLVLKGAIVTIDAMGCQKAIAEAIADKGADYVLALKGNQGELYDDVRTFFESEEGCALPALETTDADHGRIENRIYRVSGDVQWLRDRHPGWKGLKTIVMAESRSQTATGNDAPACQTRFYISSVEPDIELMSRCIRGHWGIENALHWVLDVTFDEDRCRVRKDNAPHILSVIKRCAINLINKNKGKSSIASIRRRAGWGNDAMLRIISS
jgi:predicted transposase YbfD/YdcC